MLSHYSRVEFISLRCVLKHEFAVFLGSNQLSVLESEMPAIPTPPPPSPHAFRNSRYSSESASCRSDCRAPWNHPAGFPAPGMYFQNQFLSHSWLPCHWSHQGHSPPCVVVCQPLATEKWSSLVCRGIWTEIAWHRHLFGSGEYTQTATQHPPRSAARLGLWPGPTGHSFLKEAVRTRHINTQNCTVPRRSCSLVFTVWTFQKNKQKNKE